MKLPPICPACHGTGSNPIPFCKQHPFPIGESATCRECAGTGRQRIGASPASSHRQTPTDRPLPDEPGLVG